STNESSWAHLEISRSLNKVLEKYRRSSFAYALKVPYLKVIYQNGPTFIDVDILSISTRARCRLGLVVD
ncbi:MAG: hypothetical protein M0019_08650, partial [Actinomycetota bacterium]|nr:hypothetical protein [Actinomycetota bacterium]